MTATATAAITEVAERKYTVEEYFELERHSTVRHEFINGKLYRMPGESRIANRIAGNCDFRLKLVLEDRGYDIIRHDVRTIVRARKKYRYPDLAVAKRSDDRDSHGVTQPELLIEVSSENSDKTDNTGKVTEYTALYSLQFYIIISQDEPLVRVYSRDAQGWRFDVFRDLNQTIALKHFDCSLKLSDIYKNVVFAEAQSDNE
jgi:Uma2 family endonuclease